MPMTATPDVLIPAKQAENAQTTQYTAPLDGQGAYIEKFTATNTSGGAVTLSVNLPAAGDAAGNGNLIVKTKSLAANETYSFKEELAGHFIPPGGSISTLASAATSLTIRCSGRVVRL